MTARRNNGRTDGQRERRTERRQYAWTTREREKKNRRTSCNPCRSRSRSRKKDNAPGKEEQKTTTPPAPQNTTTLHTVFYHGHVPTIDTTSRRLTATTQKQTAPARSATRPRNDTKKAAPCENARVSSNTRVRT